MRGVGVGVWRTEGGRGGQMESSSMMMTGRGTSCIGITFGGLASGRVPMVLDRVIRTSG